MALPAAISCLLLSVLIAVTPLPGSCEERARPEGSFIKCYDEPEPAALANAANATEFLSSLLPLLAELPSAAAPMGFASLNSTGRAFIRGLCFGDATVPSECLGCLSVAARNLTSGCGATTRRAGIWTDGCFVGYGDTRASSPAEDAFRSRVLLRGSDAVPDAGGAPTLYSHYLHAWLLAYMAQPVALSAVSNISAPRMVATADAAAPVGGTMRSTVHVLAQCARDRTAPECLRCLLESAREIDWAIDADRHDGDVAAAVVGFDCYLCFNVSTALVLHPQVAGVIFSTIIRILVVLLLVVVLAALCLCLCLILPNGKKKTMKGRCTLPR